MINYTLNEKATTIFLIVGLIKKVWLSEYFSEPRPLMGNVKT